MAKKASRSRGKKSRSRSRSRKQLSEGARKWHKHLMTVYREGKRRSPSYSLKKAMKAAKSSYRKSNRRSK